MMNQKGFGLLSVLMVIAIALPLLYLGSASTINQTSSIRSQQRQRMQARDAFQNLAVLLRQAYDKAKASTTCTRTNVSTPSGPIPLCISANSCVANEVEPTRPFCLQTGLPNNVNVQVMASNIDFPSDRRWWVSIGWNEAHAQTKPSPSLPTLVSPPSFNRPTATAPVRRCNGTDLACLTLRLCMRGATCTNDEAYYQRIGFTPPH